MPRKIRLVPQTPTNRTDIERLAEEFGWTHHRTTQQGEQTPYEITWLSPDRGAAVHWIEDHLINVHYLLLQGPDIDPTLHSLKSRINFYTSESLQQAFDETRDGSALMDRLHVLGVHCSGPFEPELFSLFRWAMHDPDPLIRRVALLMASLTSWSQFVPLLDYIRTHDPDEPVRAQAETIFDVMSKRTEPRSEAEQSPNSGGSR